MGQIASIHGDERRSLTIGDLCESVLLSIDSNPFAMTKFWMNRKI